MSACNAQWSLFWILLSYMYCRLINIKPAWIVKKKSGYLVNNLTNFSKSKEHTSAIPSTFIHFTFFNDSKVVKNFNYISPWKRLAIGAIIHQYLVAQRKFGGPSNWTTANFELWTGVYLVPNFTCKFFIMAINTFICSCVKTETNMSAKLSRGGATFRFVDGRRQPERSMTMYLPSPSVPFSS